MASARLLGGGSDVSAAHIGPASILDPAGIAAKVVRRAGLTPDQVYSALGTVAPSQPADTDAAPAGLADLRFGHNYIGTEHLLLGVIDAGGPADAALAAGLEPGERTPEGKS